MKASSTRKARNSLHLPPTTARRMPPSRCASCPTSSPPPSERNGCALPMCANPATASPCRATPPDKSPPRRLTPQALTTCGVSSGTTRVSRFTLTRRATKSSPTTARPPKTKPSALPMPVSQARLSPGDWRTTPLPPPTPATPSKPLARQDKDSTLTEPSAMT